MGRLVMAYWDCPVCGTKGIAGNVMNCPACGRARGDVKFYMKDGADQEVRGEHERGDIEYLNEEQSKEMDRGADWYCSFCNSLNRESDAFCTNCGASRESSESNYFDQLRKREEAEAAEKEAQAGKKPQKKSWLPLLLVIAAAIIGLFIFLNGSSTKKGLQVTDLSWRRAIPVEQNLEFTESDWSVPPGGKEISHARAVHHYDQVLDHYEKYDVQRTRQVLDHYETEYTYSDRGNGTYEEVSRQKPVYRTENYTETVSRPVYRQVARYQTKYTYTIWRWTKTRTAEASGKGHEAAWPETNLAADEREGSPREEEYTFTVTDEKEKSQTWRLAEEDWRKVNIGDGLSISTQRSSGESWIVDDRGEKQVRIYAR